MSTFLYGYSNPPQRLTPAQLETKTTWRNLDPEFKRRLLALFEHGQQVGRDIGIGGGWRSSTQQEALFRSRYHIVPCPGQLSWAGVCWTKNPGVASSAPPGRSYHEDSTPDGAIAADLIGDIAWGGGVADLYGLRDLSGINSEPWHFQPVEVPTARRNFDGGRLQRWRLPDEQPPPPPPPPPPEPLEEDDVLDKILIPKFACPPWFPHLGAFESGTVRPIVSGDSTPTHGTGDVTDEGQYRRLCHWAGIQLVSEQPGG